MGLPSPPLVQVAGLDYIVSVMKVREIEARSVLNKTGISAGNWCLNPYTGCQHACAYCYATFMKKYSGHDEPWGEFVDVKTNAPRLLARALARNPRGEVIISSVTDPYQPVEAAFKITRACLELLVGSGLEVTILTKSSLVSRDIDILMELEAVEVGLTITTDREDIRQLFEPRSSSIQARLRTLATLAEKEIPTYAFIGPILPMDAERLAELVSPYVGRVLIDRMNYQWKVRQTYRRLGLAYALEDGYFEEAESTLVRTLSRLGVEAEVV